jgi:hypothetical protein
MVSGAAAPTPPCSCFDVSVVSLTSKKSIDAIQAAAQEVEIHRKLGYDFVSSALSVRYREKVTSYEKVELPGKLVPFIVSAEGAIHEESWEAIKKLKVFKYGANVRRFILQSSCSLLRDRAAAFYLPG